MSLEIVAERDPGFDEPVELQMVWNPPGVTSQSEATIAKGATNVFYQLNASDNAEARTWKITVLGHATVDGGQVYVSSQLADLEIASPFVAGKMQTLVAHPGETAVLTVDLEQLKSFAGTAKVHLLGLPDKITAPEKEISKDDQKVIFDLSVNPKCPPGSFKNLFCSVAVPNDGQTIPHNIATGGILRIVPVKKQLTPVAQAKEASR